MSVQGIVYLVNKATLHVSYAGPVPETHGNISGLKDVDYSVLRDLAAHFPDEQGTYANLGFLTEAEALEVGITPAQIAAAKEAAYGIKWQSLDDTRNDLIQDQRWRIDRNNDEKALGLPETEDITPVLQYCQAIRDLPKTNPDPFNIVWPTIP